MKNHLALSLLKRTNKLFIVNSQNRLFNSNRYDYLYKDENDREKRINDFKIERLKNVTKEDFINALIFPFTYLKNNLSLNYKELRAIISSTPKLHLEHGDCEILYEFNKKDVLDKWHVNTDAGYKLGKSNGSLILTQHNTALFSGYLSKQMDDSENPRGQMTGYVNMRSLTQHRSFGSIINFSLHNWTHFLFKVRGDGRTYTIILNTPRHSNLTKTYVYSYPLFTRGGPYWQYSKIPISKFIAGAYGRITDVQYRLPDNIIQNIGITLMDKTEGNFSLEVDYIGLVKDNNAVEDHSYEMFKVPKFTSNT